MKCEQFIHLCLVAVTIAVSFATFGCGHAAEDLSTSSYVPGAVCGSNGGFNCDGACVPGWLVCDGERDCDDYDDEANCTAAPTNNTNTQQCQPPNIPCADGCIPQGTTCCGRSATADQHLVYCSGELRCRSVSTSIDASGYECACPTGEQRCNGQCIDDDYSCCPGGPNGWHCKEGECRSDPNADDGFSCYCPSGQKWCDRTCVPSGASCCGEGSGGLYCNSGTCFADAGAELGYSCGQPTGVCLYHESDQSACGSPDPGQWKCDAYSTTLADCRADHRDDSFCAGSCCWHTYRTQHQIYQGSCSQALASKN